VTLVDGCGGATPVRAILLGAPWDVFGCMRLSWALVYQGSYMRSGKFFEDRLVARIAFSHMRVETELYCLLACMSFRVSLW
jgi:hypothetical protein